MSPEREAEIRRCVREIEEEVAEADRDEADRIIVELLAEIDDLRQQHNMVAARALREAAVEIDDDGRDHPAWAAIAETLRALADQHERGGEP